MPSAVSGRDEDEVDRKFHHLFIEDRQTGDVVGTDRMQTAAMARTGGYYSARLFRVEALPPPVLLHLLWRGLAAYLAWSGKHRLGPPARDREFKPIDWLVLLDIHELERSVWRSLFR